MFKKILIANRGRDRAARDLAPNGAARWGIRLCCGAIPTRRRENSMHVRMADEAILRAPPPGGGVGASGPAIIPPAQLPAPWAPPVYHFRPARFRARMPFIQALWLSLSENGPNSCRWSKITGIAFYRPIRRTYPHDGRTRLRPKDTMKALGVPCVPGFRWRRRASCKPRQTVAGRHRDIPVINKGYGGRRRTRHENLGRATPQGSFGNRPFPHRARRKISPRLAFGAMTRSISRKLSRHDRAT